MRAILIFLAFAVPALCNATMVWTANSASHAGHTGHAGHGGPVRQSMALQDGEGATTLLWLPTLERRPLTLQQGAAALKPSGLESYHLLYAMREANGVHETALRYTYMNGKPSGRSPAELVYAQKAPLEIVPAPLTREHSRYESEKRVAFMLRFEGQPLPEQPVTLETSNGSHLEIKSDAHGRIAFDLPNDFPRIEVGRDNNLPADFFLYAAYRNAGHDYRTSLSAPYHVNPLHWQSQSGALWSGLAGFVSGLGLLGFVARRKASQGEPA